MKTPVRALFFDVGGTLIHPWPSVGAVYATVAARHGWVVEPDRVQAAFREAWRHRQPTARGLTTADKEWWRQLVNDVRRQFEQAPDDDYFEDLFATFAHAPAWRVYPDVRPVLEHARQRVQHLGLISNWDARLRPLLGELGLDDFDSITISCEVGVEKPSPAIFQQALRAAAVAPDEALHVGDSRELDVAAAAAVGMRSVRLRREAGATIGDGDVRSLLELDLGSAPGA